MTVAIMPGLFVAVVAAGRNQLIQNGWHVSLQPGLELNRTDRRRAADVEDIGNSSFDTRGVHDGGHLLGDVFHVPVTFAKSGFESSCVLTLLVSRYLHSNRAGCVLVSSGSRKLLRPTPTRRKRC